MTILWLRTYIKPTTDSSLWVNCWLIVNNQLWLWCRSLGIKQFPSSSLSTLSHNYLILFCYHCIIEKQGISGCDVGNIASKFACERMSPCMETTCPSIHYWRPKMEPFQNAFKSSAPPPSPPKNTYMKIKIQINKKQTKQTTKVTSAVFLCVWTK